MIEFAVVLNLQWSFTRMSLASSILSPNPRKAPWDSGAHRLLLFLCRHFSEHFAYGIALMSRAACIKQLFATPTLIEHPQC